MSSGPVCHWFHYSGSVSRSDGARVMTSKGPDAGALYEAHATALLRYLTRLSGDSDVAADAVQEAFARLMSRTVRDERPRAWLFRVGTNLVREWARTGKRRAELLEQAPPMASAGEPPDPPDADAERRVLAERVRAVLDRLPERDRTILLMREEGFTHHEIAAVVGTASKSVGTLVARALAKLRDELPLQREGVGT